MAQLQQGDVVLAQTADGGDICIEGGVVEMSGGLETAAYLSLFGGNFEDDTLSDSVASWWGNLDEQTEAGKMRSETQRLIESLPLTSSNLVSVEIAAGRDLAWLISENVASSVTVTASVPKSNTIKLVIDVEAYGEETAFTFVENWRATQ